MRRMLFIAGIVVGCQATKGVDGSVLPVDLDGGMSDGAPERDGGPGAADGRVDDGGPEELDAARDGGRPGDARVPGGDGGPAVDAARGDVGPTVDAAAWLDAGDRVDAAPPVDAARPVDAAAPDAAGPRCGDGRCDADEDCSLCVADCACAPDRRCVGAVCQSAELIDVCAAYGGVLAGCVRDGCPRAALLGIDLDAFFERSCRAAVRHQPVSLDTYARTLAVEPAGQCDHLDLVVQTIAGSTMAAYCAGQDAADPAECAQGCGLRVACDEWPSDADIARAACVAACRSTLAHAEITRCVAAGGDCAAIAPCSP
ncbi:MAG: hypothetical protein H6704_28210 [Myxococcales bacterium]|nr:hypothetical protein [Myxococcales bacterium]